MAEGLFTLGWRKIGIRVIATEAFCDPPHKGVIAELRAITPEVVMLGDALRWTVDKKGKLKALDPLVGVPTSVIRRVGDLANMAVHSVTAHVEDVMTLEMKEITTDILIMMSERRGELLQLVLGMAQEPTHPVEDPIMAIGFDHGSPIVIVGADTRAPLVEKVVEWESDQRVRQITYPVRNLPPAQITWNGKVTITLPGVPMTSPLYGWTASEDMMARMVRGVVQDALLQIVG